MVGCCWAAERLLVGLAVDWLVFDPVLFGRTLVDKLLFGWLLFCCCLAVVGLLMDWCLAVDLGLVDWLSDCCLTGL
jgi:hypothetical protein